MKLKSIAIENYRSIVSTTKLALDPNLTVILGPNNEGKSNLLRAVVVAMEILRMAGGARLSTRASTGSYRVRSPRGLFDWDTDFPLSAQESNPDGKSKFTLEFELSDIEQRRFRAEIGFSINEKLPIEISIGNQTTDIRIRKRGSSATKFTAKNRDIARFIGQHFEFEYIQAIRPSEMSLRVVDSLIDRELASLQENPDYKAALKTIEEFQRPVFDQLESDVSTYLKLLLPSVRSVQISSTAFPNSQPRFRVPSFIVDDGTPTELDAKGDGIKSLVAIALMRATRAGGAAGDLVVAIEEPESHLHPAAIRQLSNVLQEMAKEHQVIITTHSPLLIARGRLKANIIVSKSKATPASSIGEIRDSLGVHVGDNLASAQFVALVEGNTDELILSNCFRCLCPAFDELVRTGTLAFDSLNGATNVCYKIAHIRMIAATPILIVDGDKSGRNCINKAQVDEELSSKYVFQISRPGIPETEIEDLVDPECYWERIEAKFGATLDRERFDSSTGKWSDRFGEAFKMAGKPWTSSVESRVKKEIALCVEHSGDKAIATECVPELKAVAAAILKIVKNPE